MRWLLLTIAFIVVPLAELWVILTVGSEIGVGPTILLLLADSMIGALLLRSQGRRAARRFTAALREGRLPDREIADGLLIVVGGALLLTPGFLTDLLGLLLLVPASRAVARRLLQRSLARRLRAGLAGAGPRGFGAASGFPRRPLRDYDVDGSVGSESPPPPRPAAARAQLDR